MSAVSVHRENPLIEKLLEKYERNKIGTIAAVFCAVAPVLYYLARPTRTFIKPSERSSKVVVITGCDTGFGLLLCQQLTTQGFVVVAACLTSDGCVRLMGKVALTVQCDVTKSESISTLVKEVENLLASDTNYVLWAVVNNAGIGTGGNIDWLPISCIRQVMDVNFFGTVETTKGFLPLLKKCKHSRIVNLSSLAGLCGSQMLNAYCGKMFNVF
jgi:NAD(P)-dependent dehydrogenase (short-subunit alcohol dehydrogenase family)